jgi:hypothetical protein
VAIRDPQSPFISSDRHDEALSKKRQNILLPSLALLFSMLLLALAGWIATRPTRRPGPRFTPLDATQLTLTKEQMQTFFDQQVRPQLDQYAHRNHQAVGRAADRITSQIGTYRQGIPAFVEDIMSWGTRFGVIGRSSQDLWRWWWGDQSNATQVREYVSAKFEKSLFSDQDLAALIEATLQQFRDDLQASQNRLYADISSAWKSQSYTQGNLHLKPIVAQVDKHVRTVTQKMAADSVMIGILAEIGGNAFADVTTQLVKSILVRIATSLATSAAMTSAASGGATGSGAAAGGAGGSLLGPGGTVIGIAAGIVVGVVTDWWLTRKFEQRLTGECEQLLSQIQDQIWIGNQDSPGLEPVFMDSIATLQKAKELALRASLAEMAQ